MGKPIKTIRLRSITTTNNKAKTYLEVYNDAFYFCQLMLVEKPNKSDLVVKKFKNVYLIKTDIAFKIDSYIYFLNELLKSGFIKNAKK